MKGYFNSNFKKALDWIIPVLFGTCIFSIPTFSFLTTYSIFMWAFTIVLIILITLDFLVARKFKFTSITLSYIVFIFSALMSCIFNGFKTFSASVFLNTIILIMVYSYSVENKKVIKRMFLFAKIGLVIFAFIFILKYRSEIFSLDFERLGSKFGDENDISIILSIGFSISLMSLLGDKKWYLIIINIFEALLFFPLSFSTGSKIAFFVSLMVTILFVFLLFGKKWYLSIITIAFVAGVAIFIINLNVFSSLKQRLDEMLSTLFSLNLSPTISYSTIGRVGMFQNGISLFLRRPLFGYGPLGFKTFSTYHNGWSHNHISDSLCNYGLVGTIVYHIPFVIYFASIVKTKKKNYTTLVSISFVVSMISIALFREKIFSYLIGVVFASLDLPSLVLKINKNDGVKLINENS